MIASATALIVALSGPVQTQVVLQSDPAPLQGTLLQAEGPAQAAAVIIPGSGPTDRDGNSPLGISNGILRQLAEGLSKQGIATVRIDKRGIAESRAAGMDEATLRFNTYAQDAAAWAAFTKHQTNVPCVWLIGHSEGAAVAQMAAAGNVDVCGLVLLSGMGRAPAVILREQLDAGLPEAMKAEAFSTLDELAAGRSVANPPAALAAIFRPSVQPYLISYLTVDPAKLAQAYDRPIFIGQGTTDLQTSVEDAQALKSANPQAKLELWEGLNHLLTEAPQERSANLATYSNPNTKIAPQVAIDVAAFIKAQP